jgi:hypothetical protein
MSFFQVQVDRMAAIRVLSFTGGTIESHSVDEVAALLERTTHWCGWTFPSAVTKQWLF